MTGVLHWTPLRPRGIGLRFRMACYRVLRAGHLHEILVAMDDSAALGRKQKLSMAVFRGVISVSMDPLQIQLLAVTASQLVGSRMTGFTYLRF